MRILPVFALTLFLAWGDDKKDDKKAVTSTNEANRTTESSRQRTVTGKLIDADCQCGVSSETTHYGLVLPDGKLTKFDDGGQAKVREALETSKEGKKLLKARRAKGKSPKVTVSGTITGDTFNLESFKL